MKKLQWIKISPEEHVLCSDEWNIKNTTVATVYQTNKFYNEWYLTLTARSWNKQPENRGVTGLKNIKKLVENLITV